MTERIPGFSTLAIHAGAQPDPTTGARATPIYQTTSFVFEDVDHAASLFGLQTFGNIYTRIGNPTNAVLEERVAALEGGTAGLAVASGHAAQVLVMHCLMQPGDEFVASKKLYGGSINQFNHAFKKLRLERGVGRPRRHLDLRARDHAEDQGDLHRVDRQSRRRHHRHRRRSSKIAKQAGVPLIVDNTLATPYLCKPIDHGADIVVHSLTKFLGGHGNSIGGMIVDAGTFNWSREDRYPMLSQPRPEYNGIVLHETFGNFAFAIACRVLALRDIGPALSPFNAFLILTGIETLPLRMQRHCDNALAVATWLADHPKVAWVSYPGLPGDRYHSLAQEIRAQGRGRRLHLRPQGRLRRGRQARVERQAVLASRQYRRHALADHPSGLDHAPPAHRRAEDAGRRRAGRGAPLDRPRGRRGHHRRPRAGAAGRVGRLSATRARPFGSAPRRGAPRAVAAWTATIVSTTIAIA